MAFQPMTEEQIERWVERQVDALDRAYTCSSMSPADYQTQMMLVDSRAEQIYREKGRIV